MVLAKRPGRLPRRPEGSTNSSTTETSTAAGADRADVGRAPAALSSMASSSSAVLTEVPCVPCSGSATGWPDHPFIRAVLEAVRPVTERGVVPWIAMGFDEYFLLSRLVGKGRGGRNSLFGLGVKLAFAESFLAVVEPDGTVHRVRLTRSQMREKPIRRSIYGARAS